MMLPDESRRLIQNPEEMKSYYSGKEYRMKTPRDKVIRESEKINRAVICRMCSFQGDEPKN